MVDDIKEKWIPTLLVPLLVGFGGAFVGVRVSVAEQAVAVRTLLEFREKQEDWNVTHMSQPGHATIVERVSTNQMAIGSFTDAVKDLRGDIRELRTEIHELKVEVAKQ